MAVASLASPKVYLSRRSSRAFQKREKIERGNRCGGSPKACFFMTGNYVIPRDSKFVYYTDQTNSSVLRVLPTRVSSLLEGEVRRRSGFFFVDVDFFSFLFLPFILPLGLLNLLSLSRYDASAMSTR